MNAEGIRGTIAYRGGNSNNSSIVGAFTLNLNNLSSNTNWNIGAAHSCLHTTMVMNVPRLPLPLEKIYPMQAPLVACRKRVRR